MQMSRRRKMKLKQPGRFVAFLLLSFVVIIFLSMKLLVVRNITVYGTTGNEDDFIVQQSGLSKGMSLLNINADDVSKNISRIGNIRLKSFSRNINGTVTLEVQALEPSAIVHSVGLMLAIDEYCNVLETRSSLGTTDLPIVTGLTLSSHEVGQQLITKDPEQLLCLLDMLKALLNNDAMNQISELNAANLDNLYMISRGGIQIKIGDRNNMGKKIVLMIATLDELNNLGITSGVMDVTSGVNADFK